MRVLTIQHAVPSRVITNAEVIANVRRETARYGGAAILGAIERRLEQLFEASGTVERRALGAGECAIDLVIDATRAALTEASTAPEDVDFVLYVGVGRAWIEPAMANVVQRRLGLVNATCFDVLDGCMSWLRAMQIAHAYVAAGVYRRGLIVNCESAFHGQIDWAVRRLEDLEHQFAAFTIGEAATATVVDDGNGDPDDFYFVFKNFPEHHDLCVIPLSTEREFFPPSDMTERVPMRLFSLSGPLLTIAARKLIETFEGDSNLAGRSYDLCVGHAATEKGSEVIRRRLGIPSEVYVPTHARFGNTVSASVPLGLSIALGEGRLCRGDRVLLIVAGAGISVGFASFTF